MGKQYMNEEEAVRTVGSWHLNIKTAGDTAKTMLISRNEVIGLKRLGTLDYLTNKHGWLIRRIEK